MSEILLIFANKWLYLPNSNYYKQKLYSLTLNLRMKQLVCIFICTLALITAGCQRSVQDIVSDTKEATVTIYTYDEYGAPSGSGSGFFIDENGTGVTNFHVLDNATKAMVNTSDSVEYEIETVLASDKKKDIVKFRLKNPGQRKFKYLTFAAEQPVQGDKVYNISAPLGLEQTFSEGSVSALREDSHGPILQVTAPISPGSSGSAILNDKGEVLAVATFVSKTGQNLNFGVRLDKETLDGIKKNDFAKSNKKFNQQDGFVIINAPAVNNPNVRLNALEFRKDATIGYFSYTNLDMLNADSPLWCEVDKKNDGFYIRDRVRNKKYYVTSSTLGDSRSNSTSVPLASTVKFKMYFPAIKNHKKLKGIDLVNGDGRGWRFEEINIAQSRKKLNFDMDSYQKNYGYAWMHEGELDNASAIFNEILAADSEDEDALNALGIIEYVKDNNAEAMTYFSEARKSHPNSATAYKNRCLLYHDQKEYKKALQDITQALNLDKSQPEIFFLRAKIYIGQENYGDARKDLDYILKYDEFKESAMVYYFRALCSAAMEQYSSANADLRKAYSLTESEELRGAIQELYNAIP